MEPSNNIKENDNPQADKAILAVKSALDSTTYPTRHPNLTSSLTTNIGSDLFQSIVEACQISRFVSGVLVDQTTDALVQIKWHSVYSAVDFAPYLKNQLSTYSSNTSIDFRKGDSLNLTDFKTEFQSEVSIMSVLRKLRYQHSCAIAVLELNSNITIEESSARMSILAEQLTQMAYLWSYANHAQKFGVAPNRENTESTGHSRNAGNNEYKEETNTQNDSQNMLILAMGKFGGFELNFSSDIDLIFFYMSDGKTIGGKTNRGKRSIDNSRFFQKVGVSTIKLLHEVTPDGFVFRVDMRLRPFGDSGNLVMSVAQAEDYYHEQGRGWERFAMIRARIITGRSDEVQQLKEIITPFAFRRYIDYGVIDSLRNMKSMIQREVRRRGLNGNIKLGAGGIREIEFMVQSLQLIQGGRDKRLQERNVLKVLPILASENLLPNSTATELSQNYRFLRRLEHCIQELDEKQTQQLPEEQTDQTIIAKVMGYENWKQFYSQLKDRLENTNQHFTALFGEESEQGEEGDDFFISLWESHISEQQLIEKIGCDLVIARRTIEILTNFKDSNLLLNLSVKGAKRLNQFFPILLEISLAVANPIETLERLLTVLRSILMRTAYLELLSENLPLLQHLVDLVSRSEWIVKRLSECPILLDELLYPNSLYQPLQSTDLRSELQQSLLRIDEQNEEQLLDAIRQFKLINELRVAAALLAERLSISQVSRYLTQLAQVIIQAALHYSWNKVTKKHGKPNGLRSDTADELKTSFLVIGYGKLGGLELGFDSDLDLVFLFDEDFDTSTDGARSISTGQFYTRLAQKLIHFLSTRTSLGVLYEVDMRLRPSGNSGLLVSHIDAFASYQKEKAWTWEHQALTRTRSISGDPALASRFEALRSEVLNSKTSQAKLKKEVVDMRIKMRKNLDKSIDGKIDLKQCKGGLVDIEFIAQYLILSKNHHFENISRSDEVIPSNTVKMIKYSQQAETIKATSATHLVKTYRKYRNYLNEQSIIGGEKLISENLFSVERDGIKSIWNNIL